jgi:signal transduction histidine kinase
MKNILKQSEASDIKFKNNYFLRARLKLSAYYAGGMFVVVLVFSLAVYNLFAKNVTDNFESNGADNNDISVSESQAIDVAKNQLKSVLVFIDGMVIILTVFGGYYLAGRTLDPIKKNYEKQKKFIADSAHELRTPLTVMKTGAEAVLMGNGSKDDLIKLTRDSLEEINFMSLMVNDLLFLAQSDGFKQKKLVRLDFGKIAQAQVESMKNYAKLKGIILNGSIEDNFFINGEGNNLKRLLLNLIKNAIDYNNPGGTVNVSVKKNKAQVILSIIDTGIGISKENLKYIFDRFYKVSQSRERGLSSTGLGLAIVKEIVIAHKGKITVISEEKKGTKVEIIFTEVHS